MDAKDIICIYIHTLIDVCILYIQCTYMHVYILHFVYWATVSLGYLIDTNYLLG